MQLQNTVLNTPAVLLSGCTHRTSTSLTRHQQQATIRTFGALERVSGDPFASQDPLNKGECNLNQSFRGLDVVSLNIDGGLNYSHPVMKNSPSA
jgi:hypothetical protein